MDRDTATSSNGTPTARISGAPVPAFAPGALVGRYVILQPLGQGAMGAVMLAHDTKLARNVAMKLLRQVESPELQERMLREARAMARLSHPNVVTVYDVGVHEGCLYLTMEYVQGQTLRDWLREPRPWREVLAVMQQAGRGLEAAHEAGIIHRDFKPANVLLGNDGRVYVLDFGIARSVGPEGAPQSPALGEGAGVPSRPPRPSPSSPPSSPGSQGLTEEGAIIGTPGYFAPETAFDGVADARSDEFSFCVTLWRALYGTAPYRGDDVHQYVLSIGASPDGRPKGSRVPAWLHEVVRRGLDPDPARRYGSMRELLAALDARPWRKRTARAAVVAAAIAGVVGFLGVERQHQAVRAACAAEGGAIRAGWDAPRHAALRETILRASDDPLGRGRADLTVQALDQYADEWGHEQTASCEATRLAGTQSPQAHARRSACLLRARQQFDVTVELLGAGDASVLRRAVDMAKSLPPAHLCTASDPGGAHAPLPADPAARAKVEEARRLVERATTLRASGPSADGLAAAERAASLAREAGDGATAAAAQLAASWLHDRRFEDPAALQSAVDALASAEALGLDHWAGLAASEIASLFAERFDRVEDGRRWLAVAQAKLARVGDDEELRVEVLRVESLVDADAGETARALDGYARYVDVAAGRYGRTSPRVCKGIGDLGRTLYRKEDYEGAARVFQDAIDCSEKELGTSDESLALGYNAFAAVLDVLGRLDESIAAYRRAIALRAALGTADALQGVILSNLAEVENRAERWVDGERDARHALAIAEANAGGYSRNVVPRALFAIGTARLGQNHPEDAREACARAVAVNDGKDAPAVDVYDPLRCLGLAELALGDAPRAVQHLERSLSLTKSPYVDDLARARFALARALLAGKPPAATRDRALQLARQARDELAAAADRQPWLRPTLERVDRWIHANDEAPPPKRR